MKTKQLIIFASVVAWLIMLHGCKTAALMHSQELEKILASWEEERSYYAQRDSAYKMDSLSMKLAQINTNMQMDSVARRMDSLELVNDNLSQLLDSIDSNSMIEPNEVRNTTSGSLGTSPVKPNSNQIDEKPKPEQGLLIKNKNKLHVLYHYPQKLIESEQYQITAIVFFDEKQKDHLVEQTTALVSVTNEAVDNHFVMQTITVQSDIYRIRIVYDPTKFKVLNDTGIVQTQTISEQPNWHTWDIIPIMPGKASITIKVESKTKSGDWVEGWPNQICQFSIAPNYTSLIARLWVFVKGNPEYTMASIIIPIITYFFGLFKNRRKNNSKEAMA